MSVEAPVRRPALAARGFGVVAEDEVRSHHNVKVLAAGEPNPQPEAELVRSGHTYIKPSAALEEPARLRPMPPLYGSSR